MLSEARIRSPMLAGHVVTPRSVSGVTTEPSKIPTTT